MAVSVGTRAYADFSYEDSDGTAHTDKNIFGLGFNVGSVDATEGQQPIAELNNVETARWSYGQRVRNISCDWVLSSPWFLHCLFGFDSRGARTGAGPHTYPYTAKKIPQRFTFRLGMDLDSNMVRTFKGCLMGNTSIQARIGGQVMVSTSIDCGDEGAIVQNLDARANVGSDLIDHPYEFADSTVTYGASTVHADIQNFSLSINPNQSLLYGLGQAKSVDAYKALMEYGGSFELPLKGTTFYDLVLGRKEDVNALKLKFSNGESGNSEKSITLTLSGVSYRSMGHGAKASDPIMERIQFAARSLSASAVMPSTITPPDVS